MSSPTNDQVTRFPTAQEVLAWAHGHKRPSSVDLLALSHLVAHYEQMIAALKAQQEGKTQ